MNKILVLILIFFGEAIVILAEMLGAKNHSISSQLFTVIFGKMFLVMTVGGALLVSGYIWGYSVFKNIWIVSAISITSILLIEPTLAYFIFHELPTKGALIGLLLGATGLAAALFVK